MNENYKTIRVKVYLDGNGKQVCAANFAVGEICKFLGTMNMGTKDVCLVSGSELFRDKGFLRPCEKCIIKD